MEWLRDALIIAGIVAGTVLLVWVKLKVREPRTPDPDDGGIQKLFDDKDEN